MKLRKHNNKGMTLVECIIAMALLSAMSAMLVTIAVAAKKQNLSNYQRSAEMYAQSARIESYNPTGKYSSNHIKVSQLISKAAGASGNVFNLKADFGTYKLDTTTYGYKALPTGTKDKKAIYTLKTLKSEYDNSLTLTPSPATGFYILKIFNYSGHTLNLDIIAPEDGGGTFYDELGNSASNEFIQAMPDGGTCTAGFRATSSDLVYEILDTDNPAYGVSVYRSNFDSFCDTDDGGNKTGYMYFYFADDGSIYNKQDYEDIYG